MDNFAFATEPSFIRVVKHIFRHETRSFPLNQNPHMVVFVHYSSFDIIFSITIDFRNCIYRNHPSPLSDPQD